ncbi:hypothetical protein KKD04_00830, partial [Patescibacteria group bacterium]|nr:hypothetical protein [Patescibacteria group bacterium]
MSNTTGSGNSVGLTADSTWISGYCGILIRNADLGSTYQWKTSQTYCVEPACTTGQDTTYPTRYSLIWS